ncbi:AAEL012371-PA [Aedes aegypti]|nr:AAEL012371-PA [Aedes aegypti]
MAKIALGLTPGQSSTSGTSSLSASLESSSSVGGMPSAAKRGRLLIRQQRIKKESDSSSSGQQYGSDLDTPDGTTMYSQNLLTVPTHHRFERQVSEPIIPTSPAVSSPPEARIAGAERSHGGHHLAVSQQPYLVKQHSHPLLPSQTSSSLAPHQAFQTISSYSLQRQLSHPMTTTQSSTPLTLVTSSSGSTHYLTPSSSLKTDSDEEPSTPASTIPQIHLQTDRTSSPTVVLVPDMESLQQQHHLSGGTLTSTGGSSAITTTITTSSTTSSSSATALLSDLSSTAPSSIRVKGEELSRSASSPLTSSRSTEIPGLDSQRSSHCPVVREGPALGCNFCWNTIDAHGRILRRKTKYHCPECQTNLCIVPCFQEYHERQSAENPAPTGNDSSGGGGGSGSGSSGKSGLRNYPKSGSM